MSNRYRVLLPLTVHTEEGEYTQGEEFDKDFAEDEESEALSSGLLEIVPREYKVTGEANVYETDPGGSFMAALRIGPEALLVDGGFIERIDLEPPKPKPKTTRKKKEA